MQKFTGLGLLVAAAVACGGKAETVTGGGGAPAVGGALGAGGLPTGGSATGGATTGGSSTGGTGSSCSNVTPCGGDVVGTWSVQSTCLTLAGKLDMTSLGIGCTSATITGGGLQVTGTWIANSDGTYTDDTTTTGEVQVQVPATCLSLEWTPMICDAVSRSAFPSLGYVSAICTNASDGGCDCQAEVNQTGQIGVVDAMATSADRYGTSGNTLLISDGGNQIPYDYCVSGSTLTMTPTFTKTGTATGTIVLQKQ